MATKEKKATEDAAKSLLSLNSKAGGASSSADAAKGQMAALEKKLEEANTRAAAAEASNKDLTSELATVKVALENAQQTAYSNGAAYNSVESQRQIQVKLREGAEAKLTQVTKDHKKVSDDLAKLQADHKTVTEERDGLTAEVADLKEARRIATVTARESRL